MYSINKVIEEYLVNFEYFKAKLLEHNIDVLDSGDMINMMLPQKSEINCQQEVSEMYITV